MYNRLWLLLVGWWAGCAAGTRLGLSTSSYQVEGASELRGVHVWDVFSHTAGKISDGSSGDVACDHYHRWAEDVENVAWTRAGFYRFSLSWTRLFPTEGNLSADGVRFYDGLINALLSKNVTPLVTLHHWDLPQVYQERFGGWQSREMVPVFREYAARCFSLFADRVSLWLTLNEPLTVATLGYGSGYHAPGVAEPARAPYAAAYHMLLAHAEAYRAFHEAGHSGSVGVALNSDFVMPRDPASPQDADAAERGLLWRVGWFADPLFFGRFPEQMAARCGDRLRPLDVSEVRGTLDFFALNHYTTLTAWPDHNGDSSYFRDAEAAYGFPPGSPGSASPWLHVYPEGIYHLVGWLSRRYDLSAVPLYVTESGVSTRPDEPADDRLRQSYLTEYLRHLLRAAADFSVEVPAYCVWSLMDNFEWAEGYSQRFGVFAVDFPHTNRTPRTSAWLLREMVNPSTGELQVP